MGKFLVQDPAARLVSQIAGVEPGMRVLDVCAAPGGKSFAAACAPLRRGCDVRLLMDGVGSFHLWPSWRKTPRPGRQASYFLPPRLIRPSFPSTCGRTAKS